MDDFTSSRYNITLKKNEEARLQQIFLTHTTDEGRMPLYQFVLLAMEKGIISNSCPFQVIFNVFD